MNLNECRYAVQLVHPEKRSAKRHHQGPKSPWHLCSWWGNVKRLTTTVYWCLFLKHMVKMSEVFFLIKLKFRHIWNTAYPRLNPFCLKDAQVTLHAFVCLFFFIFKKTWLLLGLTVWNQKTLKAWNANNESCQDSRGQMLIIFTSVSGTAEWIVSILWFSISLCPIIRNCNDIPVNLSCTFCLAALSKC